VAPQSGHAWHREYIDADTHEEIKKAIRQNIYYGANTIKMAADIFPYVYSEEDIAFAVKEAAAYGLRVSVHVGGGPAADNVIRGGAASIEHGFFLDKTQLQLMKEKGTFLVGTDFSYDNWLSYGMDPQRTQELFETTTNRLKWAYDIGVRMAFGSDVVYNIPGQNRLESSMQVLHTWKAAGIPPLYILKTMTTEAAALMGIEKERGKLAPGWFADIVAFRKDPTRDILDISTVQFVMKNGKVVRKDP
jgi:imidazolonepropionase-like amidohydrolase